MTTRTSKSRRYVAPKLTAHTYEFLAGWLAERLDLGEPSRVKVARSLASELRGTNPRFDEAVFLRAAGVDA